MRMLIIKHDAPNENGKARTCIVGKGLKWLEKIGTENALIIKSFERAFISQSDEILWDPDNLLEDDDISDLWIADYNSSFEGVISFRRENVIELRMINDGYWRQVSDSRKLEKVTWCIFHSSYAGEGIYLPMVLDEQGLSILDNQPK